MVVNLRPLKQEQRQSTRKSARETVLRVVSAKPTHENVTSTRISRCPVPLGNPTRFDSSLMLF